MSKKNIVIVGGGFAGMSCAKKLIADPDVHVTLIDKNNYHEFTPLLYQVAASSLSTETAAVCLRSYFTKKKNIAIKMAKVISVDPKNLTVLTEEGESYHGDYLVLAAGSVVNFFDTSGASGNCFPLYTLSDAERLRSRILRAFEEADRNPELIKQGVLNFVIVGAGATGTEVAGSIADMIHFTLAKEYNDMAIKNVKIYLVNHGQNVLGGFSEESQSYAAKILKQRGVELLMGIRVDQVTESMAILSNGKNIPSKTIIWAGGLKAQALACQSSLPQGEAGRIIIRPDLTVEGFPAIYALGDFAVIPAADGKPLPQLAAVAEQSGKWAANNIAEQIKGKATSPFEYVDKGIMAMIGRRAAVVEIGQKRRELTGFSAYLTWLFVHAALLSTFMQKVLAFTDWIFDCFNWASVFQILDRQDDTRIIWKKEP
jgi:NADH:ubiquinone reductase (H+-translocating)